jgi:DNA polymerase kappa
MLAKICSELNKPNGQTYLPNDEVEILKFMMDLPVRKVPGIGKVNEHILAGLNIYCCKDLVEKATEVYVTFTEWAFQFLVKSALGIGKVMHEKDDGVVAQRSMGVSCTFKPIHRYNQFLEKMFKLAAVLEDRANQSKVMGKTLVLEFKNFKFETKIKSMTFPHYLYTQNQFKKYGMLLLNQAWPIEPIRLMGLRM